MKTAALGFSAVLVIVSAPRMRFDADIPPRAVRVVTLSPQVARKLKLHWQFVAPRHKPDPHICTAGRVFGLAATAQVRAGETLLALARRCSCDSTTLARLNRVDDRTLRPGMTVQLPTRFILPAQPSEGVVLNIPERAVYIFHEGKLAARFPTAVGKPSWHTPQGTFFIASKVIDPIWAPPRAMVTREGVSTQEIGPGPKNPLGDRWMGWSGQQVGFHSTYSINSVGRDASHGCVRLYPELAHRMFNMVSIGTPIFSIYRPIMVGYANGVYYLSVVPDLYHEGAVSTQAAWNLLRKAHVPGAISWSKVAAIVRRADGYPHPIARALAS